MAGYTPLFQTIVMSSIWQEDSDTCKVWITMLALASAEGIVEGSIVGLAHSARVSTEVCMATLEKLKSPDLFSRTKDDEGRRIREVDGGWLIINHTKYRNKAKSRAAYMRKYRQEKKKVTKEEIENTNLNTNTNAVTQSNAPVTCVTVTKSSNKAEKGRYLDHVFLTREEYKKLIERFDPVATAVWIEKLDSYIGSKGKKYKSHYKTIISWSLNDATGTDKNQQGTGSDEPYIR